jgi:hypothetical protein
MRYIPHPRPDDNPFFPWHVVDTLDNNERMGPGFSPKEAAIVAWALSNGADLAAAHSDLQELIRWCVDMQLPSFKEAVQRTDGAVDPSTRAYLRSMGLDPDGTV